MMGERSGYGEKTSERLNMGHQGIESTVGTVRVVPVVLLWPFVVPWTLDPFSSLRGRASLFIDGRERWNIKSR